MHQINSKGSFVNFLNVIGQTDKVVTLINSVFSESEIIVSQLRVNPRDGVSFEKPQEASHLLDLSRYLQQTKDYLMSSHILP